MNKIIRNPKILGSLLILSLLALVVESYFLYQNYQHEIDKQYEVNLVEIQTKQDSIDLLKLKSDLRNIDQSIGEIRGFLISKNLKLDEIERLDKDSLNSAVHLSHQAHYYSEDLVKLAKKLQEIPLGVPVNGYVSSNFGERTNPIPPKAQESTDTEFESDSLGKIAKTNKKPIAKQFHKGLDVATQFGSDVKCAAEGKVIFSGAKGGYGNCVIIEHKNGLATLYGHLSKLFVKVNQSVKVSEVIAKSGNSGRSTGPHLHYEVHKNKTPINPKLFLNL